MCLNVTNSGSSAQVTTCSKIQISDPEFQDQGYTDALKEYERCNVEKADENLLKVYNMDPRPDGKCIIAMKSASARLCVQALEKTIKFQPFSVLRDHQTTLSERCARGIKSELVFEFQPVQACDWRGDNQ